MEENNNINKLSPSDVQKLKMNPPDHAWNRLDAELARKQALVDRQKANRYRMLFILTGLLLLCSVSYLYFGKSGNKTVVTTASQYRVHNAVQNGSGAPGTNSQIVPNNVSSPEVSNSNTKVDSKKKIVSAPLLANVPTHNPALQNRATRKQKNTSSVNNNNLAFASKIEKHSLFAAPEKQTSAITDTKVATNDKVDNINTAPANTIAAATVKNNIAETPGSTPTPSTAEKTAPNEATSNITDAQQLNNIAAASADKVSEPAKATDVPATTDETMAKNNSANTPHQSKAGKILSKFSIAAAFSPDYSRNTLKEAGSSSLYQLYTTPENVKSSFTTGLSIRYDLTDNWSISLGGDYSTLAYSVSVPAIYAYTNSNNELHYMYPTACGVVEMPNSNGTSATYKGESLNNASCSQVVRFINLPLMVRYQVHLNKFALYGEGGVAANFTIQERANITINNTETTVVNNIDGLKNMNYSFILGIGLQYNINKHIGIFAEPSYTRSINSLTENIPVNCYPYSIGLNTGVSVHF